jgi:hypothetical protein
MNIDFPWITIAAAFFVVIALFFAFRSFKMPSDFKDNLEAREELQKKIMQEKSRNEMYK